jgi:hypothetical protein
VKEGLTLFKVKANKFLHYVQNDRYTYFPSYTDISLTLNIPAEIHTERSEVSVRSFQLGRLSFRTQ